jgi:glycosyltransferase involved in cell wall biosynthesis
MKIAHVMMGFDEGGARTFMLDLAAESRRRGHDVHVVGYHEAQMVVYARDHGLPFHCASRGVKLDLVGPMLRTRRLFRHLKPDVVHTHTYFPHIVARPAARLAGVPAVVSSIHTNLSKGRGLSGAGGMPLRRTLVPILVAATDRFADRLFVVSRDIEKEYVRRGVPQHKVFYLHTGVHAERFAADVDREAVKRELGIDRDACVVGTVGSLIPRKRVDLIINLAVQLRSELPNIVVLVVGDGPERSNLERLADDLGVAQKVRFVGARNDVQRILPAMDVFVLASTMEGTARVLMEAMASGTPCVATAVGGTPDIMTDGESGLLVPPGDGGALADAVAKLAANDDLRKTIARTARRRAHQDFDVMKIIRTVLDSYEEILAGRADERRT